MRLNVFLFRFLPFRVSRHYIAVLGRLYYLINRQEKKLIEQTISYVFRQKFNAKILNEKIKATFRGIFDHYHEKLFIGYSCFNRLPGFLKQGVHFTGEEKLQEALRANKGAILVTGHFDREWLPDFNDLSFPDRPATQCLEPTGQAGRT
jgi:KDO2-lipid IV(A) lauroyltransferase